MSDATPPPPGPPPPGPPMPPPPGPFQMPAAGPPRRNGGVVVAIIAAVLVLGLIATTVVALLVVGRTTKNATVGQPSAVPSAKPTDLPPTAPSLARFYSQNLAWRDCGPDQCAALTVPLDYAKPAGPSIRLAVLRVPAQNRAKRIGSLVVNPGGPGGSGVLFAAGGAAQFGVPLADRYDIVGFDPRGVGLSDPLHCLDTSQLDSVLSADPDPDNAAERARLDQLTRELGDGCLAKSGDLARHMSTQEVAKDMDILRAALGEKKLDYLGSSYGTFIGATYAEEFPSHVGRFVLDGAIDPALSNEQLSLQQAGGFEVALRAYVQNCIDAGNCFLGDTVAAGTARIGKLLTDLDSTPLPTSDNSRPLTEGLGLIGVFTPLYVKSSWPDLSAALEQALVEHRGTKLLAFADQYASRGADSYTDNSMVVLYAVNCLDHDDSIPTKDVPSHFAQFEKVAPTFGRAFAFSLSTCANWPVRTGAVSAAIHAKGAPPIVVVGTTRDPATPYAWAKALASELDSGRLITRDGDGHTGFQRGNSCVDNAVEAFLLNGKVPPANLKC